MLPKSAIQSDLSGYLLQGGLFFEDSDSELRHQFQSHCGVTCNKIQFQYLQNGNYRQNMCSVSLFLQLVRVAYPKKNKVSKFKYLHTSKPSISLNVIPCP